MKREGDVSGMPGAGERRELGVNMIKIHELHVRDCLRINKVYSNF